MLCNLIYELYFPNANTIIMLSKVSEMYSFPTLCPIITYPILFLDPTVAPGLIKLDYTFLYQQERKINIAKGYQDFPGGGGGGEGEAQQIMCAHVHFKREVCFDKGPVSSRGFMHF